MKKFIVTIELANETMKSAADVADALRDVAHRIESVSESVEQCAPYGFVNDRNGNTVGQYEEKNSY